ncbi:hypothetical protein Plhal304r1_c006g0025841 [Plasmopara halstedii]
MWVGQEHPVLLFTFRRRNEMSDPNGVDKSVSGSHTALKNSEKEYKIDEVMDFLKFSVKSSTTFRGTILFMFKDMNDVEPKTTYAVEINEMQKVATRKNVKVCEERPTCKVTISMDDFLWIYSGKANSADLARLFYAGRVVITGYAFRTVSKFAQSFDFSSEKWRNFYALRKAQDEKNYTSRSPSALEDVRNVGSPSRDYWYFHVKSILDCFHITKVQRILWETSLASLFGEKVVLASVRHASLRDNKNASSIFNIIARVVGNSGPVSADLKRRATAVMTPNNLYKERELRTELERILYQSSSSATIVKSFAVVNLKQTASSMFDFISKDYIKTVKLSAKERQRRRHHRNRVDLGDAGMAQLDKLVKVIGKGGHSNLKRDNRSKYVPAPELLLREFRVNVTVLMDKLKEKASGHKALHEIPAPEMSWLVRNGHSGSMVIADSSSHDRKSDIESALLSASPTLSHLPQRITVEVNRAKIARSRRRFEGPKQRIKAKFASFSRDLLNETNPVVSHLDEHLVFSDYL